MCYLQIVIYFILKVLSHVRFRRIDVRCKDSTKDSYENNLYIELFVGKKRKLSRINGFPPGLNRSTVNYFEIKNRRGGTGDGERLLRSPVSLYESDIQGIYFCRCRAS